MLSLELGFEALLRLLDPLINERFRFLLGTANWFCPLLDDDGVLAFFPPSVSSPSSPSPPITPLLRLGFDETFFINSVIVVTFPVSLAPNEEFPSVLLLLPNGLVIRTGLIRYFPFFVDSRCFLRTGLFVVLNERKIMPSVEVESFCHPLFPCTL